jgi:hypothetical protein
MILQWLHRLFSKKSRKAWPKPSMLMTESDFKISPVWEFDIGNESVEGRDETWMIPVFNLPVTDLANRVIYTRLQLKNGQRVGAVLTSVSLENTTQTKEFIGVTAYRADQKAFDLMRSGSRKCAPDEYMKECSPDKFAAFLGYSIDEVFPMSYDISTFAVGHHDVIKGTIESKVDLKAD